jgi:hypothetical protein
MSASVDAARAALLSAATHLATGTQAAIDTALDDLLDKLAGVTPVDPKSPDPGRMKRGYSHPQTGPSSWDVEDEAPYSGYVIGGTRYIRPNAALNAVLDDAETELAEALDVVITRVVADLR